MRFLILLFLAALLLPHSAFPKPAASKISFESGKHIVSVIKGMIFYDSKKIYTDKDDDFFYNNKNNGLRTDHGVTFLFMAVNGAPNLNRLYVYEITPVKAKLVANAILSPVKDYDHDGYLEFGGSDLTEAYSHPDSMYYIPTAYYQIRNGKIRFDQSLTKASDIALNGLYLPPNKQKDKEGNCCKVIWNPNAKERKRNRKLMLEVVITY